MKEQSDRKGDRLKGPVTESVLPSQLRCGGVLNATLEIRNLRSATIRIWNLQSNDGQPKRFVSPRSSPRPVHTESNTVARKP